MDSVENINYIALTTPIYNGIIKDKSIKILIREIDTQKYKEEYAKRKLKEWW